MSVFTEWPETRLKNLFVSVRNGVWGDDPDGETGVFCARGTDFDRVRNRISDSKMPRRSITTDVLRDHQLRCGDLVLEKSGGSTDQPVGSVAMFDLQIRAVCSNFNARLQVCDSADSRFVCYLMNSLYSSGFTRQFVKQTTGIQNLDANAFLSQHCALPPLDEQRRIADFLDAENAGIDHMLAVRGASRTLIEEKALSTITERVTLGTGPTRNTGNPWIPVTGAEWDVVPLKRRWRIIDCKHRTPTYVENGYPVISPGDISSGRLDTSVAHRFVNEEDYRDLADHLRRARRGDIVYGRNASVGVAAFVDTEDKFTMGQDVCRITSEDQNQLFLAYFLNSAALSQLGSLQIGSTFTRINIGTLLELSIACPPPDEQRRLAGEMDVITDDTRSLVGAIDRQLDLLAEHRQALITAAVTGQIDVTTAGGLARTEGAA